MGNKASDLKEKQSIKSSNSLDLNNKARRYSKQYNLWKSLRNLERNKETNERDKCLNVNQLIDSKSENDNVEIGEAPKEQKRENTTERNLLKQTNLLKNIVEAGLGFYMWDMGFQQYWRKAVLLRESGVELSDEMIVRLLLVGYMQPNSTQAWLLKLLQSSNTELTTLALSTILEECGKEHRGTWKNQLV